MYQLCPIKVPTTAKIVPIPNAQNRVVIVTSMKKDAAPQNDDKLHRFLQETAYDGARIQKLLCF